MKSLHLASVSVCDEDLEAVLPFLPNLRSVRLLECKKLTSRTLVCLPHELDALDVSLTSILDAPTDEFPADDHAQGGGTRTLRELVAGGCTYPSFRCFLAVFAGHSLKIVNLRCSSFRTSRELLFLLTRTTQLQLLDLRDAVAGFGPDYILPRLGRDSIATISSVTGLTHDDLPRDGRFSRL